MQLSNKRILVTGGAGFIGSHLVDELIRYDPKSIVVVDNLFLGKMSNLGQAMINKSVVFKKVSCADTDAFEQVFAQEPFDVVFNLAIIPLPASLEKPEWCFEENVKMTENLCRLARLGKFRSLVHFSSSEVYGTASYVPIDEQHPCIPHTTYAASKLATDALVLSYHKTFGIRTMIVRPFNNYGPRQNKGSYAGVIPNTIYRLQNHEKPIIYGDGLQTRDFIFVRDTARLCAQLAEQDALYQGKIINICSNTEITILDLMQRMNVYCKSGLQLTYEQPRPGDVLRLLGSDKLLRSLIDYQLTPFEQGIAETIDWYNNEMTSHS